MINIKTNIAQFIKTEIKQWDRATKKATVAAMNKAAQQGRSEASRVIREDYTVKTKGLKTKVKGHNALGYTRAKTHDGTSTIVARGKGIPLIHFKTSQVKKGVNATVKRRTKLIPGAFKAKMPSGHKGVFMFMRKGRKRRKAVPRFEQRDGYITRLPIDELFGPGAATLLNSKKVKTKVKTFIVKKYPQLYEDAFNHFNRKK